MNPKDFPGAIAHAVAFQYFRNYYKENRYQYSLENQQQAWGWFLTGWKFKAIQHDTLRGKR